MENFDFVVLACLKKFKTCLAKTTSAWPNIHEAGHENTTVWTRAGNVDGIAQAADACLMSV